MADLRVSYIGGVESGVAKEPMGSQTVTTSGTSAKSNTNPGAGIVVVFSDAAHWINIGPAASVTATATNGMYLPANVERHLALGAGEEVAAITV